MAKRSKPKKTPKNTPLDKAAPLEGDILEKLPQQEREIIASMFAGPLPHPDEFNKYPENVQKAITHDARAQMKHRHKIENKIVSSDVFAVKVGSIGTIAIYVLCILGTVFLFAIGRLIEGILVGSAAGIAKSLVLFRSNGDPQDDQKGSPNDQ